tara:strand:+ start:62 stop:1078 length:1017 start_codon:yes stop_codon:yes gene_type:complete
MKTKYYLIIFLFFLICAEFFSRNLSPKLNKSDSLLGWKLIKNLDLNYNQKNLLGDKYLVNFKTNQRGARSYGNEENSEIKILAIGDSMTNGPYSSNDKTWFAFFAKKLELKSNKKVYVEAIGSGGYGNFQQYLLTKELLKSYDPDFVILQLCTANDFYNNSFEWETNSIIRNQYARRPYLVKNKIKYYDGYLKYIYRSSLYENIIIINRVDWILILLQSIFYNLIYDIKSASDIVDNIDKLYEYKKNSILITDSIFYKIKDLFPKKKIYSFNACKDGHIYPNNSWIGISKQNSLIPLDFFKELNFTKESYSIDGGHLNENGNKILGEKFFNNFIKHYK